MTRWTAVVPLKLNDTTKSRLSGTLPATSRLDLVEAMARHVLKTLGEAPQIDHIVVLSHRRPIWWSGDWAHDRMGQLNDALADWRLGHGHGPVLVIHGDLPYLCVADLVALFDVAEIAGLAMATDAAGEGTNAVAIADSRAFRFQFGARSRAAHAVNDGMVIIERPGLANDIDSPAELAQLLATGFFKS